MSEQGAVKDAFGLTAQPGEEIIPCEVGLHNGLAMGPAHIIRLTFTTPEDRFVEEADRRAELDKLQDAIRRTIGSFTRKKEYSRHMPIEAKFDLDRMWMVTDGILAEIERGTICEQLNGETVELGKTLVEKVQEGKTAERATYEILSSYAAYFRGIDMAKIRAQADDVEAIMHEMIAHMDPETAPHSLLDAPDRSIPVVRSISFGDAYQLRSPEEGAGSRIKGTVNWEGSDQDHFNINARASGITVARIPEEKRTHIKHGDMLILDGHLGLVILSPSQSRIIEYQRRIEEQEVREGALLEKSQAEEEWTTTRDGEVIKIGANIGHSDEVHDVNRVNGRAIGLYRTETAVVMHPTWKPSAEDWNIIFSHVFDRYKGQYITVRTVDFDGDKATEVLADVEPGEPRRQKIRDIAREQMAAVLRVAQVQGHDKVRMMIPVVHSLADLETYTQMMREEAAKQRVTPIRLGIMDEVKDLIDELEAARAYDIEHGLTGDDRRFTPAFISIGSNDLMADVLEYNRFNPEEVAAKADGTDPRFLKRIARTAALHSDDCPVSICGDIASNPRYFALLVGAGLREMSAGAAHVPEIKELVRRIDTREARALYERIIAEPNRERREEILIEWNYKHLGLSPDDELIPDWVPGSTDRPAHPPASGTSNGVASQRNAALEPPEA